MTHGSLFTGIGGFDLAAEWMGWENAFHCEKNEFCQKVLKYYWPNATCYEDIKKTDFTIWRGRIDVLTGGFPCQPYSVAGKQLGTEDERHLWPEMLRAIQEIKPTWIVGENVRGLVSWNGGLVFEQVQADLEAEGYEVQPFLLPAAGVGAPHKRDRVWFVAYTHNSGSSSRFKSVQEKNGEIPKRNNYAESGNSNNEFAANTTSQRLEREMCRNSKLFTKQITPFTNTNRRRQSSEEHRKKKSGLFTKEGFPSNWQNFPTQSPICCGNDGLSSDTYIKPISKNRNGMDRNLITKKCLEEGRLKVDLETGKIYSLKQRGKEGKEIELPGSDCNGYIVHGIRYNGFKIQLRAHQIVWIAANGLYDKSYLMIDHINRDKKDNRLLNLRLVDAKGNRENATCYNGKLTEEQKDMMVWLHKEDGIPLRELAVDYGISKSRVHQIVSEHNGMYGITFSKWRNESIKAYGNAIVPQVALQIFKAIESFLNDN